MKLEECFAKNSKLFQKQKGSQTRTFLLFKGIFREKIIVTNPKRRA